MTRFIHDHLDNLPSLEHIAERWNYSRSHFSRAFRAHLGLPPQQYILNARLALAKQLLRETDQTIGQIATRAGYPTIFAFSRQFRHMVGTTATAYRTQSLND